MSTIAKRVRVPLVENVERLNFQYKRKILFLMYEAEVIFFFFKLNQFIHFHIYEL